MEEKLSRTLPSRTVEFIPVKASTNESVGALIFCQSTNRYLFLLRNGNKFDGTWGISGGKIEQDETVIAALRRELEEEIKLKLTNEKIIPLETYTAENNYFCYHTFLIIIKSEFIPTLNNEHRGWAWTKIEDVPRPTHPGLFKTIKLNEIQQKLKTVELQSLSTN